LRLPVLYVTHSRDEALMLGGRALIYERGRVAAEGLPEELFAAPASETVARLTGVENILEGSVVARDESAGTMTVELQGEGGGVCRVEVPLGRAASGARVRVAVRSGDILLAAQEPRGLSARNVLRGRVASVEGRSAHTLVRVRSGGVTWTANITRHALEELGLEAGREVWLAFKTYSCRVYE
ncbi:MAG TPA: TOBE domain-containing protein, partial [Pyrinomonadaceae bacterium]|nr:TOBE domain-containing protein [Pyrinomonadaceae bacterium]